ncbi:hypothetical protein TNCV_2013331 [Trichonephila clavipes]|nr:hypothetical protein TNCV_2013331 [Trichonephila clavipes]
MIICPRVEVHVEDVGLMEHHLVASHFTLLYILIQYKEWTTQQKHRNQNALKLHNEDKETRDRKRVDFPESWFLYETTNGSTTQMISMDGACLLVEKYHSLVLM